MSLYCFVKSKLVENGKYNFIIFNWFDMVICMVAVCKISKDGKLIRIKEVSDKYRYFKYDWEEN